MLAEGARLRDHPRGLRRLGRRPAPPADGGLLPLAAGAPRRAHGRRRAGRRPVELRRRQPRATAASAPTLGPARAVEAGRGRHRRAGPRGPRPLAARRARSPSSGTTGRAGRRPPAARRWPRWSTSFSTGCRTSGRPRTRCWRRTRGWRTARCRPRSTSACCTRWSASGPPRTPTAAGAAPLASVEGYVRQVVGWREYVWSLYWHLPRDYRRRNALAATADLPEWFRTLDADRTVTARCLSSVLARRPRARLGAPHPPADGARQLRAAARLGPRAGHRLVRGGVRRRLRLGDAAQRRRHEPARRRWADGHQAVRRRRRVHQPDERLLPAVRVRPEGPGRPRPPARSPPGTGRSWTATRSRLEGNPRMRQPLRGLARLADREALVEQERDRGSRPP